MVIKLWADKQQKLSSYGLTLQSFIAKFIVLQDFIELNHTIIVLSTIHQPALFRSPYNTAHITYSFSYMVLQIFMQSRQAMKSLHITRMNLPVICFCIRLYVLNREPLVQVFFTIDIEYATADFGLGQFSLKRYTYEKYQ